MWMHYVLLNLPVSAYLLAPYAPQEKDYQAWLRSAGISRMGAIVVGFLTAAYFMLVVAGSDAHWFRTVIASPFVRLLEGFAGVVAGWILLMHEDRLIQAGNFCWPMCVASGGALALCWLLGLGQPVSPRDAGEACLRTIELPHCMPYTQVLLPRSGFLIGASSFSLVFKMYSMRRQSEVPESVKTHLQIIDNSVQAIDVLLPGLALKWSAACAFVTLFRALSIDVWILSNAVARWSL